MAYGVYVRNPTWVDGSGGGTSIDAADLNANDLGVFNAFTNPCAGVPQRDPVDREQHRDNGCVQLGKV